jgi:hypothetical protein
MLMVLTLSTALWVAGCGESNGKDRPKPPPKGDTTKVLNKEVQSFFETEEGGAKPGVVFVLYDNGQLRAFRREDQKPVEIKPGEPIHADNILDMKSVSIIKTSNPKYCWFNSLGDLKCVSW